MLGMSKIPSSKLHAAVLLALASAFGLGAALSVSHAAVDARFGLVGTGGAAFAAKFGLTYYTLEGNYAADKGTVFSSVDPANDPAAAFSVVREVAKLNVRNDGLGETNAQFQAKLNQYAKDLASWYVLPSWARGSKPVFAWYNPNAPALIHAESLQIVETIRREKARNPVITGTVWEIGNEPNFFPAITPAQYAAIFENYSRVIKAEDPTATVAMGAIFLPELAEDLKARFSEELETQMRAQLQAAGMYNTLNSLGVFPNLVADVRNTVLSRTLSMPAREYLRQTLEATTARPDLITVHAYPYDDRVPFLDSAALKNIVDTTAAGLADLMASKGIAAIHGGGAAIWITEFGNIEQGLDADQVAERSSRMTGFFLSDSRFGRWFHYKPTGSDDQFALFSSGPAPLTRLAAEPGFAPADGNFPCSQLNAVGLAYWRASHGGVECTDPVVPPVTVTPPAVIPPADSAPAMATVTPPLQPRILNEDGAALSSTQPLLWGWQPGKETGLDQATVVALVELFHDSAGAEPFLRADSIRTGTWAAKLTGEASIVWARLKVRDAQNRETPWSAWKKLAWAGSATTKLAMADGRIIKSVSMGPNGKYLILRFGLQTPAFVKIQIADTRGQVRRSLYQGRMEAGEHGFPYDGRGERGRPLARGVYFCRIQAKGEVRSLPVATILP